MKVTVRIFTTKNNSVKLYCNLCLYTKKNGIKYPAICPMELTTGTQFMIHVNAYMCMSKYTVYMYMLNQATGLIK